MKEQEIVDLLLQKNENGINELLKYYGPLMRYIIAPILPGAEDQEDCLSEVSMRVWDKIEQYDSERGSLASWITAVTRNTALNHKRDYTHYQNSDEINENTPSPESSPEDDVIRQERQLAVKRALKQLSSKEQILFYRKYYYLQSTAQIASEMGMTERAVEGKLYRLKKRLRKILGGEEYVQK